MCKGKKGLCKPNTIMCKNLPWFLYLMIRLKNRTVKQLRSFLVIAVHETSKEWVARMTTLGKYNNALQ